MYIGGIEAGGTKFLVKLVNEDNIEIKSLRISTRSPKETMEDVYDFFKGYSLTALGIACFGPLDLNESSPNYGCILNTPKVEWQYFNIYQELKRNLHTDVYINTDVALAGLAEYDNNPSFKNVIYITVGTGIGAAIIKEGAIITGVTHSEMGHIRLARYKDDNFASSCIYHDSCLEGLASGVSLQKRYNLTAQELSKSKDIWDMEAYYLACGIYNYILTFQPDIIYLGGGVASEITLIPLIMKHLKLINNSYIDIEKVVIKNPSLDASGLLGAVNYARRNLCTQK